MIGRLVAALAAAVLLLTGCGSGNSGLPDDTHCGHSANGVLCLKVLPGENSSTIGDVIGYYSPTTSLKGKTWRLSLVRYDCDPVAGATCRPMAQYPGPARHTPPPVQGTCVAVLYDTGRRQCTTRLAAQYGSHADWAGLPRLPSTTLGSHAWLCMSAELAHGPRWQDQFARAAACYH